MRHACTVRAVDLLAPVPISDLHASIHAGLDQLLHELVDDERNVLLTLARMIVTSESGHIVPKERAADLVLPDLREPHRSVWPWLPKPA
jgi:aminoglycoside 9-adenylyltransferase